MTDRYIDPNSGAAPQPGGYANQHGVQADTAQAKSERDPVYDKTIETQAAPLGPQPGHEDEQEIGPVGSYVGDPSLSTDAAGQPRTAEEGDDSEVQTEEQQAEGQQQEEQTQQVAPEPENQRAPAETEEAPVVEAETEASTEASTDGGDEAQADVTATDADGQQTDVATEEEVTTTEAPAEEETTTEEQTSEEGDGKPAGNAGRDEWVAYAKSEAGGNMTDEELKDLGRNDIRDLYA